MATEKGPELNGNTVKGTFGLPIEKGGIFIEKTAALARELIVEQGDAKRNVTPTTLITLLFDTSKAHAVYRAWQETLNPAIEVYVDA